MIYILFKFIYTYLNNIYLNTTYIYIYIYRERERERKRERERVIFKIIEIRAVFVQS